MPVLTRWACGVIGGAAMIVAAGCGAPSAAPSPTATSRPVPPSAPASSPSPSASASPHPAAAAASAQPSPTATRPANGASPAAASPVAAEQPVTPETNPAGDIPDNQVFVTFTSAIGGYSLQVPEGWARTDTGADVRFVDKLDGVQVAIASASAAPTAASAQATQVANLQRSGRAVQVTSVQDVQLPAGPTVFVEYTSNSDPDPVTNKQVRLENNAYLFYNNGELATLMLWAPLGADNVDQWQSMAQSFRWQ